MSTYDFKKPITINAPAGAFIYYTLDGSEPTVLSTLYIEPVTVTAGQTLKAIAVKSGFANSPIASAAYTKADVVATLPQFKPGHTLPRLTTWSNELYWNQYLTAKALVEIYGFAFTVSPSLDTPELTTVYNLAETDPDRYPIALIPPHSYPTAQINTFPETMWTHIDSPGTVKTRTRMNVAGNDLSATDSVLSEIRQYAVDGHTAAFYKCIQASGSKTNPPTVHQGDNAYWIYITPDDAYDLDPMTNVESGASPLFGFNPEAPITIYEDIADTWATSVVALQTTRPTIKIPIIINGGEYGLRIPAFSRNNWTCDPTTWTALGESNTWQYLQPYFSTQKERIETPIADVFRKLLLDRVVSPNNNLYVAYFIGAASARGFQTSWVVYAADWETISSITDTPSTEMYFYNFVNWTQANNMLSGILITAAQQIPAGNPLSYQFVANGERRIRNYVNTGGIDAEVTLITGKNAWPTNPPSSAYMVMPLTDGTIQIDDEIITYEALDMDTKVLSGCARGADSTLAASHLANAPIYLLPDTYVSDQSMWMGYLKMVYAAGAVGACVFHGAYESTDPHWLWGHQYQGHVHALFSHLEDYLRDGDLLEGADYSGNPISHKFTVAPYGSYTDPLPAYEFQNSADDEWARVIARKRKTSNNWLIAAWAQDGVDRNVTVNIPTLGFVTVNARVAGSVYTHNGTTLTLIDTDAMYPSADFV